MAIVTISQQLGSGGTEVGMAVADRLGYCFVAHKRFQEGAHRYGLETDRLWHLEEERPSLFERFDGEATVPRCHQERAVRDRGGRSRRRDRAGWAVAPARRP